MSNRQNDMAMNGALTERPQCPGQKTTSTMTRKANNKTSTLIIMGGPNRRTNDSILWRVIGKARNDNKMRNIRVEQLCATKARTQKSKTSSNARAKIADTTGT